MRYFSILVSIFWYFWKKWSVFGQYFGRSGQYSGQYSDFFLQTTVVITEYDFLLMLPKSFWGTFKTIFKTLSVLGGLSHDPYWRGGVQEIHEFKIQFSRFLKIPVSITLSLITLKKILDSEWTLK